MFGSQNFSAKNGFWAVMACGFVGFHAQPVRAGSVETMLYAFKGAANGATPSAWLAFDAAGQILGTTFAGGFNYSCEAGGDDYCGTIFRVNLPAGKKPGSDTVISAFKTLPGGYYPAGLVVDSTGNMYGITLNGGNAKGSTVDCASLEGCGTVFRLKPPVAGTTKWTRGILYAFPGGNDGARPVAGLVIDGSGDLYGTTFSGGSANAGTVYRLSPPAGGIGKWKETVLYSFQNGSDGGSPAGRLISDAAGNLYGMTTVGGLTTNCFYGCGVVYEISKAKTGWAETVLYQFQGNLDGALPIDGLAFDGAGNLYGATQEGGPVNCGFEAGVGCGTLFELSPPAVGQSSWRETQIYAFTGGNDGGVPSGGVTFDGHGNFWGLTSLGGYFGACANSDDVSFGCGAVYRVSPGGSAGWNISTIYSFTAGPADGAYPGGDLIIDGTGKLYGLTSNGGRPNCLDGGCGTVFEIDPSQISN